MKMKDMNELKNEMKNETRNENKIKVKYRQNEMTVQGK